MDNMGSDPLSSPPSPATSEQDKADRLERVLKLAPALQAVAERLWLIEQIMGNDLADCIKEQPLGLAVDIASDIKMALDVLHGDGSGVATNAVKKRLNFIREVTLPAVFEEQKIKTFNTDRFRVTKTITLRASIIPEEKDKAFAWLDANQYGDLIKPTVNASSLSAVAKELIEGGRELPEEHFRTHSQDSVSITKLKPKRG